MLDHARWNDYVMECRTTAIYPTQYKIAYPTLGLVGEVGELLEVLESGEIKINNVNEDGSSENYDRIIKEAGDVCWYIANVQYDLTMRDGDDVGGSDLKFTEKFREDNDVNISTNINIPISWTIYDLEIDVFRLAEKVKKIIRDGKVGDRKFVMPVLDILHHMRYVLEKWLMEYGIPLDHVLTVNLEKLVSRKQRGVLGGSGDNR